MKLINLPLLVVLSSSLLLSVGALAEIDAVTADGRAVTLFDDNTWRYADAEPAADADAADTEEETAPVEKKLVLTLENLVDTGSACTLGLRLQNNSSHRVADWVPQFSAYTLDNVIFDTKFVAFQYIKPTLSLYREVRVMGLGCSEISVIRMHGADRCKFDELDKWNANNGECLALVRLEPTDKIKLVQQYESP